MTKEKALDKIGDDEELLSLHLSYFRVVLRYAVDRRSLVLNRQSEFMKEKLTLAFSWHKFIDEGRPIFYNFVEKKSKDAIPPDDLALVDKFAASLFADS